MHGNASTVAAAERRVDLAEPGCGPYDAARCPPRRRSHPRGRESAAARAQRGRRGLGSTDRQRRRRRRMTAHPDVTVRDTPLCH